MDYYLRTLFTGLALAISLWAIWEARFRWRGDRRLEAKKMVESLKARAKDLPRECRIAKMSFTSASYAAGAGGGSRAQLVEDEIERLAKEAEAILTRLNVLASEIPTANRTDLEDRMAELAGLEEDIARIRNKCAERVAVAREGAKEFRERQKAASERGLSMMNRKNDASR